MKITQTRRLHCVECIDRIIEKEVRVPNAESARRRGSRRRGGWGLGREFPSLQWGKWSEKGAVPSGEGKGGCAPSPKMFLIFELKMVRYGAFWVLFLRGEIGRYCMWQWLEVRGPGAAPSVPRDFWKARGPSKQVRGPGILWLTCNSNSGGMTQYSIHPKQSTISVHN